MRSVVGSLIVWSCLLSIACGDDDGYFRDRIAPILERNCVECHRGDDPDGGLSLTSAKKMLAGGDSGDAVSPGDPDGSLLLDYVMGDEPEMPVGGQPLADHEIDAIRKWIADGAVWPEGMILEATWWSFEPLVRPSIPDTESDWARTPVDAFILEQLKQNNLAPSAQASKRTLIRRLYFDLIGLPPTPDVVDAFVSDDHPKAYERLVDQLLDSPRYGERWARHWLDVVHYGDTHGYEKDKVRPHAWPYRDYVIRAFNDDKPYRRFIREQVAGDVLFPETRDGVVATGFIAAGPFDWVGHTELLDGVIDKEITRNLDRDDMVSTTMNSFTSLTAQCARCHDHKFDPISQEDYYSLQAVFAGVERADRPYPDEATESRRKSLAGKRKILVAKIQRISDRIESTKTPAIKELDREIADLQNRKRERNFDSDAAKSRTRGYHSKIEATSKATKWVQVDFGKSQSVDTVTLVPSHVKYAHHPGPGFGFPVRFKIEISDDAEFSNATQLIGDFTHSDFENPGDSFLAISLTPPVVGRYVRVTAFDLWERTNDYAFALAEILAYSDGHNVANGATVTFLDTIESSEWSNQFLVDGFDSQSALSGYTELMQRIERQHEDQGSLDERIQKQARLMDALLDEATRLESTKLDRELTEVNTALTALPPSPKVYAATKEFKPIGNFRPLPGGQPREIHVLHRGEVGSPGRLVQAGTVGLIDSLPSRFEFDGSSDEGRRRVALAEWIAHRDNPLTWRSIVNRVWHYHFGRGIVDSPNDFGRMGTRPTHPQLLDWLAVELRDGGDSNQGQSLKQLHRLILTSAVYQQVSDSDDDRAKLDAGNRFLWRMNRRRLEAEAIHDSVLAVAGKLNTTMGGPGYRVFGFKDDHSPRYKYQEHDPDDPASHRRSIYRFVVRSVPDPFLETLDCADPSQSVSRRNETLTALQALALLNNRFMIGMSGHLAARVTEGSPSLPDQVLAAFELAFSRDASTREAEILVNYANEHGLPAACRLMLNMNEFVFVD